jgi:hypothetical protein
MPGDEGGENGGGDDHIHCILAAIVAFGARRSAVRNRQCRLMRYVPFKAARAPTDSMIDAHVSF